MMLGGINPPPNPVMTRSASSVSRFGAIAHASMDADSAARQTRATGRRPNESDNGPADTPVTAHAAKVAVANCPATATEISRSVAISTSSGGTIRIALIVARTVSASTAMNHALFTSLCAACAL